MKKYKYEIDYIKKYNEYLKEHNEDPKDTNIYRFDYGIIELKKLLQMTKRKLISKSEYNNYRKQIELQLFDIE